ncbi:Glycine cleavage system transcriptional activator [Pigmentiphaga humi]|uniref:Glycine cleavage system transcriptional activator n=1 Tax=Pigmentiphaga humi TaxID=2478468 RepID=A0A3P4B7L4_9BURK|nr:LysR substrate-binding domain-containing protein [Pigmentiphaga humi]VCU71678.1 Glycine cleavage system transcriptional activator [Pigmentiphaga humi]
MKRVLAPLNPMRSFEAAARLMSFTAAGEELNVTQAAISRQVRVLEQYLGQDLFVRQAQAIQLTEAGARLYPAISKALDDMAAATAQVDRRRRPEILAIQAYSTFAQCWLIRKLSDFQAQHADIDVRLSASSGLVDFEQQNLDAVIYSGVPGDPGLAVDFLTPIELLPVMSPALLRQQPGRQADLSRLKLLHSLSRPSGWSDWLRGAGMEHVDGHKGHKFESSAMAFEAAIQGAGVALGVRVLVEHYISAGVLVAPFSHVHTIAGGYYLARSATRPSSRALNTFREWLLANVPQRPDAPAGS